MNHSPLPWRLDEYGNICDAFGYPIMLVLSEAEKKKRRQQIVHCVNLHADLVAELRRSLQWLASYPGGGAAEQWERVAKVLEKVESDSSDT